MKTQAAESWHSRIVPMAVGFLTAWLVVALISVPAAHSLSWAALLSRSAWLIALAAVGAVGVIWAVCRMFRAALGAPTASLRAYAWSAAIWLPLLTLVWNEHTVWMALAPLPIAGILTHFFRRQQLASRAAEEVEDDPLGRLRAPLFLDVYRVRGLPVAREAMLLTLVLMTTLLAAADGRIVTAQSLLIVLMAGTVWSFTTRPPQDVARMGTTGRRGRRVSLVPCYLLTCLALTPFLRQGLGSSAVGSVVMASVRKAVRPPTIKSAFLGYRGIILLAPPLPKQEVVAKLTPAALTAVTHSIRPNRPMTIRFDGAYRYFELFPTGAIGTRTQRGDPLKANVRSEDEYPLTMEAVQELGSHVESGCCGGLDLALTNGDNRVGRVDVEVILRDRARNGKATERSLGVQPVSSSLPSRISLYRPTVNETLHFSMRNAQDIAFNEVVVKFHLSSHRNLSGAKMKIREFVLQP